jgi:stage IV sporulation protein FB
MFKTKFKAFTIYGIPVYINLLIGLLFVFLSVEMTISIILVVLLHEMAHAFTAKKKGYNVNKIELNFYGGVAEITSHMSVKDTLIVVAAGPLTNLVLAALAFGINIFLPLSFWTEFIYINLVLFVFNILPIMPMDGGRILMSILQLFKVKSANRITYTTSLICSIIMFVFSIIFGQIFLALFAAFFGYNAYTNLKK